MKLVNQQLIELRFPLGVVSNLFIVSGVLLLLLLLVVVMVMLMVRQKLLAC